MVPENGQNPPSNEAADVPNPNALADAISAVVDADPGLERVTVTLPTQAVDWLREEARARNISTGEMLRTAVGTQKFLLDKIAEGAKIQVRESSGISDLSF